MARVCFSIPGAEADTFIADDPEAVGDARRSNHDCYTATLLGGSSHVHRFCGLVHQSYLRGRLAPTEFPLTNHQGRFTLQVVAKSVTLQVSWMRSFPFFK